MCGIVGIVNHKAKKGFSVTNSSVCNTFDNLLWADQLRGLDGTGIMRLNKDLKIEYIKAGGPLAELKKNTEYTMFKSWVDASFFTIGHNRSATKGTVCADNSHPFTAGNIVLVHNGTLTYYPDKYEHDDPVKDVDSLALTKMIAELGIEKAVNEFTGAYACVWLDESDLSLNIARNYERPLSYIETEQGLVIASEVYLAAWAASRNGIVPKSFHHFDVNTHYKILASDITKLEIVTKYEPKPPKKSYTYGGFGMYDMPDDNDDKEDKSHKSKYKNKKSKKDKSKRKERFIGTKQLLADDGISYKVGDLVCVSLDGFKTTPQANRYSFNGRIEEGVMADVRHRILGNTALPYNTLTNLDNLYTATISSIMVSPTGFYLVNVKDLKLLTGEEKGGDSTEEAPKSAATTPLLTATVKSSSGKISKECDCCGVWFPTEDLSTITSTSVIGEGKVIKIVQVCRGCNQDILEDFKLFEETHKRKIHRAKHGDLPF